MTFSHSFQNLPDTRPNHFAAVIFLPRELDAFVAPLRERFDPDWNIIAAHVTLVFPFESDRDFDDIARILREETAKVGPLEIKLSSIGDYYPRFPVIYWKVEDNPELTRLHRSLYARLDIPLPVKDYCPHVTVAREISQHRVMLVKERIVANLPDERFQAKAVDLVAPVADHNWVSVRTFPLPQPE
jgi:2'-5' RNA ligase